MVSVCLYYFLVLPNIIWLPSTSLDKFEDNVQIHHLHQKCFHVVKRLRKSVQNIWRYSTKYASFLVVLYPDVHNELCQLWSYWAKFTKFLHFYRGIIYAINAHIEVAISYSVSECQSDE